MKVENVHSSPNFCMAIKIFDSHTAATLKRRLASERSMKEFKKLVKSQMNNRFNIGLTYVYDKNNCEKLRGCVYNGRDFYREYKENDFTSQFLSPIDFIKIMCGEADKIVQERNAKIMSNKTLDFKV